MVTGGAPGQVLRRATAHGGPDRRGRARRRSDRCGLPAGPRTRDRRARAEPSGTVRPTSRSSPSVGVLITLLVRILGRPADVELLVGNIHVQGTTDDRAGSRWPLALADPHLAALGRCRRHARPGGTARHDDRARSPPVPRRGPNSNRTTCARWRSPGWRPASACCSAPRSGRPSSRSRSRTGGASSTTRRSCRRRSAHSAATPCRRRPAGSGSNRSGPFRSSTDRRHRPGVGRARRRPRRGDRRGVHDRRQRHSTA